MSILDGTSSYNKKGNIPSTHNHLILHTPPPSPNNNLEKLVFNCYHTVKFNRT